MSQRRRKRSKPSPAQIRDQSASKKHKSTGRNLFDALEIDQSADNSDDSTVIMPPKFSKDDLKEVAAALMHDFKDSLIKSLKAEFIALVEAQTSQLVAEVTELKRANEALKESLKTTNQQMDDLDQYGRRMCLEVANIPGDSGDFSENVEAKLLNLSTEHNVELKLEDIDRCHRLGRYRPELNHNRRIIVKFANSKARQRIYESRRSLGDGIFVQEHLTKLRSQLAYEARQLQRSKKILKTWVAGAKVFVNMMDKGKELKCVIKDMDDIERVKAGTVPV